MSRMLLIGCAILSILPWNSSYPQQVVLNEIMSKNEACYPDEYGEYYDWIELYNASGMGIQLQGYFLSDDPDSLNKWQFPYQILHAFDHLVIFAAGLDSGNFISPHTNFKISSEGEPIFLSDPEGTIVDLVFVEALGMDQSYGRTEDGVPEFARFYKSSPGLNNNLNTPYNNISSSHDPGIYQNSFDLFLLSGIEGAQIHYTLDGLDPTPESPLYENPIPITNLENANYDISVIPTTPLSGPWQLQHYIWQPPQPFICQINTLRYRSFIGDEPNSEIRSNTFIIDEDNSFENDFPLLSIITPGPNLFDYDTGIYIPGFWYDSLGWSLGWHPYGNYMNNGMEWERDCHLDFFETDGDLEISQDCGMRIQGNWSAMFPQKSLRLTARDKYGNDGFKHPLFPESDHSKYKEIILRNSGNDMAYAHFRDMLIQSLLEGLDMETQFYRPSTVYINGEYWGIHNMSERYNEHYFDQHFDLPEDSLIVIGSCGYPEIGSNQDYAILKNYIANNDLSIESVYDSVASRIDIQNFTDYHIAEIFFANFDWPGNNNRAWKTTDPASLWRWLIYDTDGGFGFHHAYDFNMIGFLLDTTSNIPPCSILFLRKLLENNGYKEYFIDRFAFHLNTTYHKDTVISRINYFKNLCADEMAKQINRWRYPESIDQWENEIEILKDFARYRPCYCADHIMQEFDLPQFGFTCDTLTFLTEHKSYNFQVFPNPSTTGEITVTWPTNNLKSDLHLAVLDMYGREVQKERVYPHQRECRINVSEWKSGIYLAVVYKDGKPVGQAKFVVQ